VEVENNMRRGIFAFSIFTDGEIKLNSDPRPIGVPEFTLKSSKQGEGKNTSQTDWKKLGLKN